MKQFLRKLWRPARTKQEKYEAVMLGVLLGVYSYVAVAAIHGLGRWAGRW